MNRSLELDLGGMLPALAGPLPRELVSLSASLIAQSRSKASSMKPEEEIARGYVCCQLACERLRLSLDLPDLVPRPPVPPRIYKKVYAYISRALIGGSGLSQSRPLSRPQSAANTPSRTPSKRKLDALSGTPQCSPSKTPKHNTLAAAPDSKTTKDAENVPTWTMPAIRAVCKALRLPHAAPHVFTGVASVVSRNEEKELLLRTPSKKRRSVISPRKPDSLSLDETRIAPLIVTVTCLIMSELSAEDQTDKEYKQQRSIAIEALVGVVPDHALLLSSIADEVEKFMRESGEANWMDMDWFHNIMIPTTEKIQDGSASDPLDEAEMDGLGTLSTQAADLRTRFGNLKNAATDWGSEEKSAAFHDWRKIIFQRLDSL